MDILRDIIDMDKEAAARAEAAIEAERHLFDESDEQSAKESRERISAERVTVQNFCHKQQQKLSQKLRQAESVREEQCAKLDESFNAHKQQWKSEILNRITEG